MRILFVTAAYLPHSIGGVELHVRGIARAMRAAGHEVAVFTRGSDSAVAEWTLARTEHESVPVFRLDYKFSDCTSFAGIYKNPTIRARFESVLDLWKPDVVHIHHLTCLSTDLVDAARERAVPVAMTLHDFWMGCPRGQRMTPDLDLCETIDLSRCAPCLTRMWSGWFGVGRDGPAAPQAERDRRDRDQLEDYHAWIRGLLLRVDQLVTPSESSRQVFGRQGVPVERIRVVENGLDHSPFRGTSRTAASRFRFGYIGSVLPTKGVHVLVEAFVRLTQDTGRDAELHVHGEILNWHEVSGYEQRLRALAAPAADRVFLHGRYGLDAVPSVLGSIDALVVPSLWREAFCLTLREGWLAGVPVIVSDAGAMKEGVDDASRRGAARAALAFETGNAADLAEKMAQVMDDPRLRESLSRAGHLVRTVEENAAELVTIYRGLRESRGQARDVVDSATGGGTPR